MSEGVLFLFIGYGAVWLVLFAYLVYVSGRIRSVGDDVREIRDRLKSRTADSGEAGP